MPQTPRQQPNSRPRRPATSRPEEPFKPHARYPRLNANAGKNEAPHRRAPRRPAGFAPRPGTPRPFIRLDSTAAAPSLAGRLKVARLGQVSRGGRWLSLVALVVLLGLGAWLLTSPNFHVTQIEVKGSRFLTTDEVVALTGVDKTNVFLLNEDEVARKIQTLPFIITASVTKTLPDHLSVEVTERQSVLDWKVSGLNYLVDNDGVVLDQSADKDLSPEAKSYPVIQSMDDRKLQMGDRVDAAAVRSARTLKDQLAQAGFKIAAIQYSAASGLTLVSAPENGNWKALIGTDYQLEQKINILKGLLADKTIKWSYADLRFVDKPAIQ